MSKCEHGVELGTHTRWEVCPECNKAREAARDQRKRLLERSFAGWIDTGFWGDIDAGVGKLYYAIYRKNF